CKATFANCCKSSTAKTYLLVTIRFACIEFNCLSRSASGLGAAHVSTISDRRFGNQHREERWPKSRNFVGAHCRACLAGAARADEGGVSFWLPGFFGSLAAAPQQPGWSLTNIYYHTSVLAGGDVALAREFEIKRVPGNLSASAAATFSGNLNATGDL